MTPEEVQLEIDRMSLVEVAQDDGSVETVMTPSIPIELLQARPDNPRINNEASKVLAKTIAEVGWGAPLLVQKETGMVIGGHTRLKAAQQLGLKRLPVRFVDVDDHRAKAMALADNRVAELATWDWNALAGDLGDFGLEEVEALGFDSKYLEDLAEKVDGFGPLDTGNEYSGKIEAPIYELKGMKPALGELCHEAKTQELLSRIDGSDISDEEKQFLRAAATRHTVFRYDKIAEYYAHASPEVQELMEASALVIIDFDQAIENGFVKMSELLMEESLEA
jgi:hypothetical protein